MSWPNREEPATPGGLAEIIRSRPRVILRGGESKPALAPAAPQEPVVSLRRISGVRAYHPLDLHITALAGTPLAEVVATLAERRQGLPFDPPCLTSAATLGGCVAAGLEGPGAFSGGGLRRHLLAVQFCDGRGQLLRAGVRALRNSAGLDAARFLAGSLGRFAALTEITLRTRPLPETTSTLAWPCTSFERAARLLSALEGSPFAFEALDLEAAPPDAPIHVVLGRIAGRASAVAQRAQRIIQTSSHPAFCLSPGEAQSRWLARTSFSWVPPGQALVKVPLEPSALPAFDEACATLNAVRTYTEAGRLAWVALPAPALLESALHHHGWRGILLCAPATFTGSPFLGKWTPSPLMRRLKQLFDPESRFLPWPEAAPL